GFRLKIVEKIYWIICPIIYHFEEKKQRKIPIDRELPVLYFCHTPYHLLITLVKAMLSGQETAIMLYKKMPNVQDLYGVIREAGLFKNVYISTFSDDELDRYYQYKQKKYFQRWALKRKLMEKEHNLGIVQAYCVKMYNDFCLLGYYLNVIRKPYDVIEDALDVYRKGGFIDRHCLKPYREIAYNYVRKTICMGYCGAAMARELEVNDRKIVYMPYSVSLREVSRQEMFKALSEEQKALIVKIFGVKAVVEQLRAKDGKKNLILTQPLWADYIVPSAEIQLRLYENLVQNMEGEIFIKLHPRDNVDYTGLENERCHVFVRNDFPIEVLNFVDVFFEECVTLCSSSIAGLINIKTARSLFNEYGEISKYVETMAE
ncbi:MAG: alpha-2,8-polysialyltransferase family protein, partial [Clostridium sp.]|nr:alpha-2,8-polysialyltransferase family protein [Clostridium sp.]